jgi:CHAT domain-containing protein
VHEIESGEELLNDDFSRARFETELRRVAYNVVHIASHGQFGNDPSQTFVLAFDGQLTMDDLERDIKFGERRDKALELLILSAWETASGDDRAALGLAGVALKAAPRSALATLWYISDKAAGELVVDFYRGLQSGALSKAHALQAAPRSLAADPRYAHPAYWAPFLLIGDWRPPSLLGYGWCRRRPSRRTMHRQRPRMKARRRSRRTSRRRAARPADGSAGRRGGQ